MKITDVARKSQRNIKAFEKKLLTNKINIIAADEITKNTRFNKIKT